MISFDNISPQQKSSVFNIAYKIEASATLDTSNTTITFQVPCKLNSRNERNKVFLFTGNALSSARSEVYILSYSFDFPTEPLLRNLYDSTTKKGYYLDSAVTTNTNSSLDPDNFPYLLSLSCTVTEIFTTTYLSSYWYFYTIVYFG